MSFIHYITSTYPVTFSISLGVVLMTMIAFSVKRSAEYTRLRLDADTGAFILDTWAPVFFVGMDFSYPNSHMVTIFLMGLVALIGILMTVQTSVQVQMATKGWPTNPTLHAWRTVIISTLFFAATNFWAGLFYAIYGIMIHYAYEKGEKLIGINKWGVDKAV